MRRNITALSNAFYNGTLSPSLGGIVFYLTVSMNRQCLLHGRAVFLYSRRPLASEIQTEITRARSSNETGTRATDTEKRPSSSLCSTIYMVHPTFIVPPSMCAPIQWLYARDLVMTIEKWVSLVYASHPSWVCKSRYPSPL